MKPMTATILVVTILFIFVASFFSILAFTIGTEKEPVSQHCTLILFVFILLNLDLAIFEVVEVKLIKNREFRSKKNNFNVSFYSSNRLIARAPSQE